MNRRSAVLAASMALLAMANAVYWWPGGGVKPEISTSVPVASSRLTLEDLRLMIPVAGEERSPYRRDLFRPKQVYVPVKKIEKPPEPPPKTPEQLEEEAARAELAQLKLVGVIFRGGVGQAYFVLGDQTYLAKTGDQVGNRFFVMEIAAEAVELKDPKTNVSGRIPVSGE